MQLEDLGFCKKGEGGKFVADGNLISGVGKLPFNTDGGGLCNNHPANRGGMTKVIEAVRQLRGEAHPKVQVKNCGLALAQGTGGQLGTRHGSATLILDGIRAMSNQIPAPSVESGEQAVLRCGRAGQAAGEEMHRLRRASSLPARDLPVLLLGQNRMARRQRHRHRLHLQRACAAASRNPTASPT